MKTEEIKKPPATEWRTNMIHLCHLEKKSKKKVTKRSALPRKRGTFDRVAKEEWLPSHYQMILHDFPAKPRLGR